MPGEWRPREGEEAFEIADVLAIAETAAALLCELPDAGEVWFPFSQIAEDSFVQEKGDEGTLSVSPWIARQKDLLED